MTPSLTSIFAGAIAWLLAGIFLQAGVSKLAVANRAYYIATIDAYGVIPRGLLAAMPVAIGLFEVLIGIAILLPATSVAGLLIAAALTAFYLLLFARQILQGKADMNCGCAGPGADLKVSPMLLTRNAVLVALCIFAIKFAPVAVGNAWFLVLPLAGMLALIYLSCEQLIANQQKVQLLDN